MVGPEGGWEPGELGGMVARGACVRRFGPHVMRVETAAVVAGAAVVGALVRG
jgi:16S rRNA U1498 N3-methylase RsmE